MATCKNCGVVVYKDENYCPRCGTPTGKGAARSNKNTQNNAPAQPQPAQNSMPNFVGEAPAQPVVHVSLSPYTDLSQYMQPQNGYVSVSAGGMAPTPTIIPIGNQYSPYGMYQQPTYGCPYQSSCMQTPCVQQYPQPSFPMPQYMQPQYAQPQYMQPQYAQPQYGQPQYTQPAEIYPPVRELTPDEPEAPVVEFDAPAASEKKPRNGFSIAGFILAFFGPLAVFGLLFSFIGIYTSKKKGSGKVLGIFGVIISLLVICGVSALAVLRLFFEPIPALSWLWSLF